MAFSFTPAQQKVLDARGHNILVSAAAGSGKTAVLVERIVRLVTDRENPLDIDRLLVVTFTRAAAAQMRERIGQALSERLSRDPENQHLQNQQVLLHNAQITTMDSFFTFLLRNYFCDIDLDPGFRQIEQTESSLIAKEVMDSFLEEKYAENDTGFLRCVEYFCPGTGDREIEELILDLCRRAGSHPSWEAWLKERAFDYDVPDEDALFRTSWMQSAVHRLASLFLEMDAQYAAMEKSCLETDGLEGVLVFLQEERKSLFSGIRALMQTGMSFEEKDSPACPEKEDVLKDEDDLLRCLWEEIRRALSYQFPRYPSPRGKKAAGIDPGVKNAVKTMRDAQKKQITGLRDSMAGSGPEIILEMMRSAREPMKKLSSLALEFYGRFLEAKREKHVIDFVDLEHFALDILAQRQEDGTYLPRRAAKALRSFYAEILIDEYQDSNEVQELMLRIISGEEDGRNNRFMVGDIKQSIYRFRLARPEIFMEKYDAYLPDDPEKERIELDQNFRSRKEVLDCVNSLFMRIMRREIGGVEYNWNVSLKQGADYPAAKSCGEHSYQAELLLLETGQSSAADEDDQAQGDDILGDQADFGTQEGYEWQELFEGMPEDTPEEMPAGDDPGSLTERQKEALLIAGRIRQIVGSLPVRDEESGQMRPARYGDIVILLRSTVGWNEDLRAVFDREGIPSYAESRTGYFAAREIREMIGLLQILDNPRQDIPLYGTLCGYFGGFSQDEIAAIRLMDSDGQLYDALVKSARSSSFEGLEPACAALDDIENIKPEEPESALPDRSFVMDSGLAARCRDFLDFVETWRGKAQYLSVAEVVEGLLEQTGFLDYCTALPAGGQRAANLAFLRSQAEAFVKTDFTGLFQFLRFIDGIRSQEIDYGEANILDENADVVRIMSIHKSKGLEFPVCFVAGLSKDFSFRKFDASGTMLFDSDWGAGIFYYDPGSRVRATTLRREEIAEKIRRDCMGEELRVLYVALTRAKEKLIMTASMKDWEKKLLAWKSKMAGFYMTQGEGKLYPSMIAGASSFAELICEAVMAQAGPDSDRVFYGENREDEEFPLQVRIMSEDDLVLHAGREQMDLSRIDEIWRGMEGKPLAGQPDPQAAGQIADRYFYSYPHEELRDLYAHTSVSEIKHRAMQSAINSAGGASGAALGTALEGLQSAKEGAGPSGEGPRELFPEMTPVPYLPSFIREGTGDGSVADSEAAAGEGGARRGTAFHRILELIDYKRRDEFLQDYSEEKGDDPERRGTALDLWMASLSEKGLISEEDAALVKTGPLVHFLRSALAARMARAAEQGRLYREQSFLMGCPADEVERYAAGGGTDPARPRFPHDEMITLQGVIDAFFVENGRIILVDYKTDRVRSAGELTARYQTQLEIYARALQQAYSMPVAEKIIYSSFLGKEFDI